MASYLTTWKALDLAMFESSASVVSVLSVVLDASFHYGPHPWPSEIASDYRFETGNPPVALAQTVNDGLLQSVLTVMASPW
jgi:hypothetical protein